MLIIHHPQNDIIEKYTTGDLIGPVALMVSAHLDICEQCALAYKNALAGKTQELEMSSAVLTETEMDQAFDLLMNNVETKKEIIEKEVVAKEVTINISGQSIILPRSMSFLENKKITWKKFGKKNAIAPVIKSLQGNFYLIYIGPGESVPNHDHTGREFSYVAAGSFNDGISNFETGDFALSTHGYTHTPRATSDDGCLVISWVEGRLNYFNGFFKPLNSLLWWYLHRG